MNDLLELIRRILRSLTLLVVALAPNSAKVCADTPGELQAIREIERLGGQVERDDRLPGWPVTVVRFNARSRFEGSLTTRFDRGLGGASRFPVGARHLQGAPSDRIVD